MSEYRVGDVVLIKGTIVDVKYPNPLEPGWLYTQGVEIEGVSDPIKIEELKNSITEHRKIIHDGDIVWWFAPDGYVYSGTVEAVSKDGKYAFVNFRGAMETHLISELMRLNDHSV